MCRFTDGQTLPPNLGDIMGTLHSNVASAWQTNPPAFHPALSTGLGAYHRMDWWQRVRGGCVGGGGMRRVGWGWGWGGGGCNMKSGPWHCDKVVCKRRPQICSLVAEQQPKPTDGQSKGSGGLVLLLFRLLFFSFCTPLKCRAHTSSD